MFEELFRIDDGGGHVPSRFAAAAAQAAGADGAGLSLMAGDLRVPLGASDEQASRAERLQFTLGDGPCLDAARTGELFAADLRAIDRRWPAFADELAKTSSYRAVVAVPLRVGTDSRGALDLFWSDSAAADRVRLTTVLALRDRLDEVLSWPSSDAGPDGTDQPDDVGDAFAGAPRWLFGDAARRRARLWVACGLVAAALDISTDDASALLRSYAFAHRSDVDQVTADVLERRLTPRDVLDTDPPHPT